jgi:hypothetical protein
VKKVFFVAALVLLSTRSSFARLDPHGVTFHSEIPRPYAWSSDNSSPTDAPNLSSLSSAENNTVGELSDLDKTGTYACPIELGKPYSISSASGNSGNAFDAKKCTGVAP